MSRFAALSEEPDPRHRHVRGTAVAVWQDWRIRVPDGELSTPIMDEVLELLLKAADLACTAIRASDN